MVAPIIKKNTVEQTGFKLNADGFHYRGLNYLFDEVANISRFRTGLERRYVGMSNGTRDDAISIVFEMSSGEKVQLTEQPTWLSSSKIAKIAEIERIFKIVSERTYQHRMQKYLDQVKTEGFFHYSGWYFYPDKRKILNVEKGRAYSIDAIDMLISYGWIEVREQAESLGQKISRKIKTNLGINTLQNTDVFFALLKHFFNLEWRK